MVDWITPSQNDGVEAALKYHHIRNEHFFTFCVEDAIARIESSIKVSWAFGFNREASHAIIPFPEPKSKI